MGSRYYLGVGDYVVIIISLVISSAIGLIFRFSGGRQKTTKEFLMAGRNMPQLPVVMSIAVTITSAVTMLGTPAETYRYGLQHMVTPFGISIGMLLAAYVFVPVYYQCGVTTVYEFLELRYGKYTRYTASTLFIAQTVLYMSVVLYGPALALSAVTNLSLKTSIFLIGGVCTFYCVMGGLKAVIWTDTLQAFLMFTCMIAFFSVSIDDGGGIASIYERAEIGKRLEIFNFDLDFTKRYTFWNCFLRGITLGLGNYGTGQLEVQRLLSLNKSKRASNALLMSILPVFSLHIMTYLAGLVLYSIYYLCDPILNKDATGLTKYDQLLPYYIVSRFNAISGLTGLCIAGIFSGSLSTISSALNSLSTVTVLDFIQPLLNLNEKRDVLLAKTCSLLYGVLCISLTFSFFNAQSLKQLGVTFMGIVEGPMYAIFLIGVLCRKGTDKCVLFGILLSLPVISWIGFGSIISGYIEPPLELASSNCSSMQNSTVIFQNLTECCSTENSTLTDYVLTPKQDVRDTFILYKISYPWLPAIGCFCTIVTIFFVMLVTGSFEDVIDSNSRCLSPVTRLWTRKQIISSACLIPVDSFESKEGIYISKIEDTSKLKNRS